jgi:hypothetical protein
LSESGSCSIKKLKVLAKSKHEESETLKMAVAMNALDLIDQQLSEAAKPRTSNKKPVFLFLKEGHKAVIRPLFDLHNAVVLKKHNKWSDDPNERVNAICASEEGKPCVYCQHAEHDKKLTANLCFYLPVHVYGVLDQYSGQKVTFKSKDESGSETEQPVQGIRLLELAAFGTIGKVLKSFREFMRDEDNCKITECDFSLTQVGSGQKKDFVLMPKAPKAMPEQLRNILTTISADNIRQRVLEALPPVSSEDKDPFKNDTIESSKIEEAFDDTITNW